MGNLSLVLNLWVFPALLGSLKNLLASSRACSWETRSLSFSDSKIWLTSSRLQGTIFPKLEIK